MVLGGSNGVGLVCSKGVFVPGSFGSVLDGSICFYGGIHTTNLFSFYGGIHTTGLLFLVLDLSLRWFGCEVWFVRTDEKFGFVVGGGTVLASPEVRVLLRVVMFLFLVVIAIDL
ncbi:hypothetical protein QL285_069438 [Trifolium repens]|nr:hypothetical protein QL285_069438 [Trifolium repens]